MLESSSRRLTAMANCLRLNFQNLSVRFYPPCWRVPGILFFRLGKTDYDSTVHYYIKNGFKPLYKTEQSEKDAFGISVDDELRSRVLFFDLKTITT